MSPHVERAGAADALVKPGPRAERRRLNVLFADLIGSTDLMERLGADEYSAALRSYHSLCTEAIRSHGGTVAQYQGDGLMCFFGFPTANEDDACQAVSAALHILGALAGHNKGQDDALHTRIGIATGTAIVSLGTSHFGGETVGACLNLASRLQDKAGKDRIVICEDTLELVGDRFRVRDLGLLALKGFAEPKPAFEVVGAVAGIVSRFDARIQRNNTPRIDREEEGEILARGFASAQRGTGHSIRVGGSAGLGKSRITRDFFASDDLKGTPTFVLQCAPEYSAVPLYPVRAYLDWITGVRRDDDVAARKDKLARLFTVVWQADPEENELLLDLLVPDAESGPPPGDETVSARHHRAFEVLSRRMFGAIGRSRAFAMIFEDVHWIDPTSLALLSYLLDHVPSYPILLIATYRTEAEPMMAALKFQEALHIDPLPDRYAKELALAATSSYDLGADAIAKIVTLAEGVPLFLEEYARMTAKQKGGPPGSGVPLTLSGIVLSKLDQIDAASQGFAKSASVMGRNFDAAMVAAIFEFEADAMPRILAALLAEQIVTQTADDDYAFSHALIRDGIYDTIEASSRRTSHIAAARWLAATDASAPAAVVALHYAQGGDVREGIAWYMKAARGAAGEGAANEAMASLNSATGQVVKLKHGHERDRLELEVLAMQGPVWMVLRGPGSPNFGTTQERARTLLEQLGHQSAVVTFHTALHSWARGRLAEALERVDALDALERADTPDDGLFLARKTMRGLVGWHIAANLEAERLLGETVALYDVNRHPPIYAEYLMEFGIFARFYLALTKTVLGKYAEGAALARDAAQLADIVRFPHAKGFAQLANFVCAMLRGDVAVCERFADEALAYSSAQGFPEFVAMATFAKGWVATQAGDRTAGLTLMRDGLRAWDMTGFQCWQTVYGALLASALIADKQIDEARSIIDTADAAVRETGELQALAPLRLARAELAAACGDSTGAATLAAEALAISDAQSAGLWHDRVVAAFPEAGAS